MYLLKQHWTWGSQQLCPEHGDTEAAALCFAGVPLFSLQSSLLPVVWGPRSTGAAAHLLGSGKGWPHQTQASALP